MLFVPKGQVPRRSCSYSCHALFPTGVIGDVTNFPSVKAAKPLKREDHAGMVKDLCTQALTYWQSLFIKLAETGLAVELTKQRDL